MKKTLILALGLTLTLSACIPAFLQPTATPAPQVDLDATAAVLVQSSLEALPSPTSAPTDTPVVQTATITDTVVPVTPSETQNAFLLTLTATLGTGTVSAGTNLPGPGNTPTITPTGTLPTSTPSATLIPGSGATPSETLHPRHFGTMPPDLPFRHITLINRAKVEAYISLQCTTNEGFVTIIEYPVRGTIDVKAPVGQYTYVAWVGGNKMVGSFRLTNAEDLTIRLFKDKVVVGK